MKVKVLKGGVIEVQFVASTVWLSRKEVSDLVDLLSRAVVDPVGHERGHVDRESDRTLFERR